MLKSFYRLARPALFALEPEDAHEATLKALELGLHPRPLAADDPVLRQTVFGLDFPNPIGIAAGFDKDARVPDAVLAMGCGFAEIGTVTPKPQPGNPKPRVFRLVADRGLINRLGFNNGGHAAALARLEARKDRSGIVGVNIGANKDSADRAGDYVSGIEAFNGCRELFHDQHFIAEHARTARPAGARRSRRASFPRHGGARAACRKRVRRAGPSSSKSHRISQPTT